MLTKTFGVNQKRNVHKISEMSGLLKSGIKMIYKSNFVEIPSEQTDLYFNEVRLSSDKNSKQIELAKQINENSQYYRNGTLDDYHLTLNNCATTTIYPIYFGISFKDISPEATFTLYKLLGKFKPSEIQSILDDAFTYFHGEGLVSWRGYQEVPG